MTAQIAPVLCKAFQLLTLFRLAIARPPLKGIARTFVQWLLLCVPALFRHLSGGIWHIITVHPIKAHLWLIYPVGHSRQGIYHPHERRLNGAQDKCTQVAMSGIVPTPKRGRSTCLSFQSSHLFGNLTTAYSGAPSTVGFCGGAWDTLTVPQRFFCPKRRLLELSHIKCKRNTQKFPIGGLLNPTF